eukprot:g28954.t1
MLYKTVSESVLGLTNVEEATSAAADTVDQVDRCAGEPPSDIEGLFCALNGDEGGGVGAVTRDGDGEVQEGEGIIRDGPGEFEVGLKGVRKFDELFKLLVAARGSVNTVIGVAEEEMGF